MRLRQAWWTALSWLILPICYLGVYYNVRDRNGKPLYPFLDPGAPSFWRWVGIMIAVFIVVGFAVWAAGVLRLESSVHPPGGPRPSAQGHSGQVHPFTACPASPHVMLMLCIRANRAQNPNLSYAAYSSVRIG